MGNIKTDPSITEKVVWALKTDVQMQYLYKMKSECIDLSSSFILVLSRSGEIRREFDEKTKTILNRIEEQLVERKNQIINSFTQK